MKRHLSVLGLWARSTIWGALCIAVLMAAAQLIFKDLPDKYFWAAGLTAMWLWLLHRGCQASGVTMERLGVGSRAAALLYALNCLVWLVFLWAAQVGAEIVRYALEIRALRLADPAQVTEITPFLAAYSTAFLHRILPMEDGIGWTMGISVHLILAVSLGLDALTGWRCGSMWLRVSALSWAVAEMWYMTSVALFSQAAAITVPLMLLVLLIVLIAFCGRRGADV